MIRKINLGNKKEAIKAFETFKARINSHMMFIQSMEKPLNYLIVLMS